jgi:hypothetical protein
VPDCDGIDQDVLVRGEVGGGADVEERRFVALARLELGDIAEEGRALDGMLIAAPAADSEERRDDHERCASHRCETHAGTPRAYRAHDQT